VELLWETPSVVERFEKTGFVSTENAVAIGLVGPGRSRLRDPAGRAQRLPPGIYRFVHLPVMTAHHEDVNSRAYVRGLETQQSIQFILKQLDDLPATASIAARATAPLKPESLVVTLTEGWRARSVTSR